MRQEPPELCHRAMFTQPGGPTSKQGMGGHGQTRCPGGSVIGSPTLALHLLSVVMLLLTPPKHLCLWS